MKVVILCGGDGISLKEDSSFIPKAMIPIGAYPIVYHIVKHFAFYGFSEFILCSGYKGELISQFFDGGYEPGSEADRALRNLKITVVDTGHNSKTGYRLKQVEHLVDGTFLLTYSDTISDINLTRLAAVHRSLGRTMTMTGAHPTTSLGFVHFENGLVKSYSVEAPSRSAVKGGYFVCEKKVFDYLENDPCCSFESKPLQSLISAQQVSFFDHVGFWKHFETYKQVMEINTVDLREKPSWSIEAGA